MNLNLFLNKVIDIVDTTLLQVVRNFYRNYFMRVVSNSGLHRSASIESYDEDWLYLSEDVFVDHHAARFC